KDGSSVENPEATSHAVTVRGVTGPAGDDVIIDSARQQPPQLVVADPLAALVVAGVGPSGAATYAGVRAALRDADLWRDLGLPDDATIVLLSTEGRQDDE